MNAAPQARASAACARQRRRRVLTPTAGETGLVRIGGGEAAFALFRIAQV